MDKIVTQVLFLRQVHTNQNDHFVFSTLAKEGDLDSAQLTTSENDVLTPSHLLNYTFGPSSNSFSTLCCQILEFIIIIYICFTV